MRNGDGSRVLRQEDAGGERARAPPSTAKNEPTRGAKKSATASPPPPPCIPNTNSPARASCVCANPGPHRPLRSGSGRLPPRLGGLCSENTVRFKNRRRCSRRHQLL
jgi:hypothetical protein